LEWEFGANRGLIAAEISGVNRATKTTSLSIKVGSFHNW